MIDLSTVKHHHSLEELSQVMSEKIDNADLPFFRVIIAYYLSVVASNMRAGLVTADRGTIPINGYMLALSPSGTGKGRSTHMIETELLAGFRERFVEDTLPEIADRNMWKLATSRAVRKGTEEKDEHAALLREYTDCGAFPFVFDDGSAPAIKQIRQKLLISKAGSICLMVDEIALNLLKTTEALTLYLELWDQGYNKPKLTKNTSDNKRTEEIIGQTPANMLLFGAPSELLNGGPVEDQLYSFFKTGYARRLLFAYGKPTKLTANMTPVEVYNMRKSHTNDAIIARWASHFASLADIDKYGWEVEVPDDVGIELVAYQMACEAKAAELPEAMEMQRSELINRYFKALKLAGSYAFIDECSVMDKSHLHSAIKLVEESGLAFESLLTRESPYMKLARHIATVGKEVTHADLLDALPFYKSGQAARNEMISLAAAWGYKKNIVIKKRFIDGIEFFTGETLKETDLNEIIISYSQDLARNYLPERAPFEKLHLLTQAPGHHWCNHAFEDGHRTTDKALPGFNLLCIDIDGEISLDKAHDLMSEHMFMTYTTKRHTPQDNRFRMLLPIRYELLLDQHDFKEFMNNFYTWLPFEVDTSGNQIAKKWLSHDGGTYHYNLDADVLDPLMFIPKTSKNENYKTDLTKLENLDNLERWFAQRIAVGNRNNEMLRYAMALVDGGFSYKEVEERVMAFNSKLSNGLDPSELHSTILVSAAKKMQGTP